MDNNIDIVFATTFVLIIIFKLFIFFLHNFGYNVKLNCKKKKEVTGFEKKRLRKKLNIIKISLQLIDMATMSLE